MAISWQRRAPVMRVLAAVYAELGEEAFKGRYGRIAKLYGNEATYDAIKSFFAKEVVTMAAELRTRNMHNDDVHNRKRPRQRASAASRLLRPGSNDSDDEIVITGENSLQLLRQSSEPDHAAAKGPGPSKIGISSHSAPLHSFRTTQTPVASKEREAHGIISKTSATNKKRSYSTFRECDDIPSSFGYVTNQGKHRCLLCMTELTTAELLRKHESMSKLHLSNLKDPKVLSRGCMMLAQVYSLAATTSRSQPDEMEPLMSGALNERSKVVSDEQSARPSCSNTPSDDTEGTFREQTYDVAREVVQISDEPAIEVERSGKQVDRNVETRESDGGSLIDLDLILNATTDERISPSRTIPRGVSGAPAPQLQTNTQEDAATIGPSRAIALANDLTDAREVEDVKATQVVQLLLSRGIELLAKQCVEEHPTLRMEFLKCVKETQREVGELRSGNS